MIGSRTIRVTKRDESIEDFDVRKLAAVMWRAMRGPRVSFEHALHLAQAVELYLRRKDMKYVSSSAIFEMVLKVFRHIKLTDAAHTIEQHREWRDVLRRQL